MKAYRDDVRSRMTAAGRDPDTCKILFLVSPVVGETEQEARDKKRRWMTSDNFVEHTLVELGSITEIDFSVFDLDRPLPEVSTNGERGTLENFARAGRGKPLREIAYTGLGESVDLTGTPDQVAARMEEVMEEIGGDGFLITSPIMKLDRRYIVEITDGLIPALRRRGLTRADYTHATFRENLLEF
jgi:alkanesulfonate monooxygenase SsuD/methylene tetrahydromethanopterin reductase-like flavin-dependent oxidoreductase (luciferase family)